MRFSTPLISYSLRLTLPILSLKIFRAICQKLYEPTGERFLTSKLDVDGMSAFSRFYGDIRYVLSK